MDVYSIKQHIINNPHYIGEILEESGYYKISGIRNNEIRCAYDLDTNSTSIKVNVDTLSSIDFARGLSGDIITLVEEKAGFNFRDSLKFICNIVGLDSSNMPKNNPIILPFGGFFKNIGKNKNLNEELKVIDDSIMGEFATMPSEMFYKDGISYESQRKYEIGYDAIYGRVVVPWRDTLGRLVGVMSRHNNIEVDDEHILKWMPIIPFAKSKTIFAYDKNYKTIVETGIVFIGESEKFSMQLDSFGVRNGLSVGGSFVSDAQTKNIQSLCPKLVVICFDEGLNEDLIREQAKKIKINNPFMNIQVGYIYDTHNIYLPRGSKASPSDFGKGTFHSLVKKCLHMI